MAEYISRSALIDMLTDKYLEAKFYDGCKARTIKECMYMIDGIPSDVAPVRHGRWVDHCVRDWRCSECGDKIIKFRSVDGYCYDDKPNFCPNCGADMRGSNDE